MAKVLELTFETFLARYALATEDGWTLKEKPAPNGVDLDCSLLARDEDTGKTTCTVHSARPVQCRTWPFWPGNLRSPRSWERAARDCEGINRGGKVSFQEIQRQVAMTPRSIGPR